LLTLLQAIKEQLEVDDKVAELAEMMTAVYELVIKADPERQAIKSKIILRLAQQTIECAIFLKDYSNLGAFGKICRYEHMVWCLISRVQGSRLFKAAAARHADQVVTFISKFRELRDQFIADKAVDVQLSVLRVADEIAGLRGDVTDLGMNGLPNSGCS
jgi:hypothetical protein